GPATWLDFGKPAPSEKFLDLAVPWPVDDRRDKRGRAEMRGHASNLVQKHILYATAKGPAAHEQGIDLGNLSSRARPKNANPDQSIVAKPILRLDREDGRCFRQGPDLSDRAAFEGEIELICALRQLGNPGPFQLSRR